MLTTVSNMEKCFLEEKKVTDRAQRFPGRGLEPSSDRLKSELEDMILPAASTASDVSPA